MKDKHPDKQTEETTMKLLNKKTAITEARAFVEYAINALIPIVQRAELATEKYYSSPSIQNGSYMADMKKLADQGIKHIGKLLWAAWKENFKQTLTEEEYIDLMADALKKYRPEGEWAYWESRIVPGLENGKEVK